MDRALENLRRAHEADPSDEQAARAYAAALSRAGEREALERLYAFKFECDVDYWSLPLAGDPSSPDERRCDRCQRSVHFVRSRDELQERVWAGSCIAFDPSSVDALAFLIDEPSVHPGQEREVPCLVEGVIPKPRPRPLAGAPRAIGPPPLPRSPLDPAPPLASPPPPRGFEA